MFAIAKKIKMTQVFSEDGKAIAVTLVDLQPNVITNIKDNPNGGQKVQVAGIKAKRVNKPESGHLKKSTSDLLSTLKEFKAENSSLKRGDKITVKDFTAGDLVTVTGTSKGKGFAGVIKRHNFHRGPKTHGSDHHRKPGSIGSMFPQHVLKGQKMPGRMGVDQVTVKNLKIIAIDAKDNLLLISGAIPGNSKDTIFIKKQS